MRQEGHQDAVQSVINGMRAEAVRRVRVSRSGGERMLESRGQDVSEVRKENG